MAGLTDQGFEVLTTTEILADFQTKELDQISRSLDVQPTALIGVFNGIVADALAQLWALGLALYAGMNPDASGGDQLASLALITGTKKRDATKTVVEGVQVTTTSGFAGANPGDLIASVDGDPSARFVNLDSVSSGAHAPATVDFIAEDAGPVQCAASSLTIIAQPVSGWTEVTNPNDGIVGKPIETDPELRVRRSQELAAAGSATADAIRADVLEQLPLTKNCHVLFNDSDVTDANGLLPHSIEAIAYLPGATSDDDTALAQLILDDKAAGINTNGTSSKVVKDSQGNEQTIYFTRPAEIDIYIDLTITVNPDIYPGDGDDLVKAALVAYGQAEYEPGSTIYVLALQSSVFQVPSDPNIGVPGVLDVTVFKVDVMASPANTANLTFTPRQIALLSTARINVTVA